MDNYRINELFKSLRYFGKMSQPDYSGKVIDYKTSDMFFLDLKVDKGGIITDIKYSIISKPVTFAICEILSQNIINKELVNAIKYVTEEKVINELGDMPQDTLRIVEIYKSAITDVTLQYNKKNQNKEVKKESSFKRLLDFGDEDDPDTLSKEQVQKLLDAVENMNVKKGNKSIAQFEEVKKDIIGNNSNKIIQPNRNKIEKENLQRDEVPDFSNYQDNTTNLEFTNRDFDIESNMDNLDFENDLKNIEENLAEDSHSFNDLDFGYEKDLDFSKYTFDNDKESDEDKDKK